MSERINWKQEIEILKSRIDHCEQIAIKLKSSLASLIKEIRTCESAKQLIDKNKLIHY